MRGIASPGDEPIKSTEVCKVPMLIETRYEHIVLDQAQVPTIAGTTMKVIELVLAHLAYGWSPDELHFQFPHLTLGQIYSTLAYYWDHRAELDEDIERRLESVDRLRYSVGESPLTARSSRRHLRSSAAAEALRHGIARVLVSANSERNRSPQRHGE
ncbi:MAG: DUF433 domain-containing protein [bacterium]